MCYVVVPYLISSHAIRDSVVIIHQFSAMWFKSLIAPSSVSTQCGEVSRTSESTGQLLQTCAVVAALFLSFISDAGFSSEGFQAMLPAYGALFVEASASSALDHTQGVLLPSLGEPLHDGLPAAPAAFALHA